MKQINRTFNSWYAIALIVAFCCRAEAFIFDDSFTPWLRTASGSRSGNGTPATLTWSIVPDGTSVSDGVKDFGGSDLLAFMNENFDGDPTQTDHRLQPWFSIFADSFSRWDELSGLTFQYEPQDDGIPNDSRRRGILGTRGDIRISGAPIDGAGGVLAFNFLPEFGSDMTLDTNETTFANSSSNYRFLRNTIMHELGHAFGLRHVSSDSDRLLMEPITQTTFDGPQLDEIRAVQFFFGDAFEGTDGGQGNGTSEFATDLGVLRFAEEITVGEDANRSSQRVSSRQTDFVSISNLSDVDFYAFEVEDYARLTAELTPEGGTFTQGGEFDIPRSFEADARSPLSFAIIDSNGQDILSNAELELGVGEKLSDIVVRPGSYFVRVSGAADTIQLYQLGLELDALEGDYNLDGIVDSADFTVWRDALGSRNGNDLVADGNGNGRVGHEDFQVWVDNFGISYRLDSSPSSRTVPEASAYSMIYWGLLVSLVWRERRFATVA